MSSRWVDRLRYAFSVRLALWYGVLFVLSAVTLIGVTYLLLARSLEAGDRQAIQSTLERYAAEYQSTGLAGLNREIGIDRLAGRHERLFVRVVGRTAEAIFFNIPVGWQDFDLSPLDRSGPVGSLTWIGLRSRSGGTVLDVASIRLLDGTLFQVGRSSDLRDGLLAHFRSRVLAVLLVIVTIAALGGGLLTWVGLSPVRDLAATVGSIIHTGQLTSRVGVRHTGDSLDELGILVNGMLDRIQALIAGMRGALDDVAHDLRTPLMRLRSVAESALASEDPAAVREGLERAMEEAERIDATLTALMDVSEAETGTMRLNRERVPLAAVVSEACDLYRDVVEEKGVALGVGVPGEIHVEVDRARFRQVVANLLDNAVKYTPAGGRIDITGRVAADSVELRVADTGVGIAESDQPRVWDRLYRSDASRGERGMGLGLSLVKAIVEAHGGRVALRSALGQGSAVSVFLPVTAGDANMT
jgi:signal transduction histidine kinase